MEVFKVEYTFVNEDIPLTTIEILPLAILDWCSLHYISIQSASHNMPIFYLELLIRHAPCTLY